jgi:hypothetical protein
MSKDKSKLIGLIKSLELRVFDELIKVGKTDKDGQFHIGRADAIREVRDELEELVEKM